MSAGVFYFEPPCMYLLSAIKVNSAFDLVGVGKSSTSLSGWG